MQLSQQSEEALLNAALALPAEGVRKAFLNQACLGDASLRGRLEARLASLEKPARSSARRSSADDSSLRLDVSELKQAEGIGQTIGRYKLLEALGEGGCGTVYVAEQIQPVRRRVALKITKLGMDTKEVIARFEAERQALAMMNHPNIARVLDAGATEAGRPFFVMELIRGIKITDFCDQNQLTTKDRLELFIKVCQAIQHAHQKGIIHRDIKPSNILVTLHDGVPVPKVIDFGIAKAIEGRLTDATLYTQLHRIIGTPAYMSPEQAELSGLDIDTRSDIYNLGVLLYELLTGRTPFDGKQLISMGVDAMRKTILEESPSRPSLKLATLDAAELTTTAKRRACDVSKLIHLLKGDLDWIVIKCLEKDRTRRYETADSLAADLRRHLDCEPVLARPPSKFYEFQKTVRRHKAGFAATATIIIVLAAGVLLTSSQALRARHAEALASKRLAESEAISSFLTEVFQSSDPAREGRTITVAETLDTAAQRLQSNLAGQPTRRAQLQVTLGKTYLALGLPKDAIPLLKDAQAYHQSADAPDHRDTLSTARLLGLAYSEAGRHDAAIPLQEDLLAQHRRLSGPEAREAIVAMMDLGNSYGEAGREAEALELRQDALRLSRQVNGPEHPDTVRALHNLAVSMPDAQALSMREEAYALSRKINGPEHPTTFRAAYNLERSYAAQGRDEDMRRLLEELVPLSVKLYGLDHRLTRLSVERLERAYYDAGRWQDALELKTDYASWDMKDLNAELLIVEAWFGKEAEYAASCRRLLKFVEGTQVPTTAERAVKASLLLPTTNPTVLEAAHALARRAVEAGAEHPFFGWFQLALGMAEYRLGNYHAADKAFVVAEKTAPVNSGFFRAMSLYRQGHAIEARRLFDETATRMKPLPDDDRNPLAGGASGDDIVAWLAYREAATLLGVEISNGRPVAAWMDGLQKEAAENPDDAIRALRLAVAFLWAGKFAEHEAHCRQLLQRTADAKDPAVHDRAAKAYLLRPNPEPATLKLAAASARRALALAQPDDEYLPWFRTVAGMAAFREGQFAEADALLSQVVANPLHENQRRLALAFRAMARAQGGRVPEAKADLSELEKLNLSLPDLTRMSPIVRDQDQLTVRLAFQEATSRLKAASSTKP